jgi:hypothetical protein
MSFPVPEAQFDSLGAARRFLIKANSLSSTIQSKFIDSYHELWGVSDPPNGSIHSVEDLQSKFDSMGMMNIEDVPPYIKQALGIVDSNITELPVAIQTLVSASALVQFINNIYPGMIDSKYSSSAFEYVINSDFSLTIGDLKDDWKATE